MFLKELGLVRQILTGDEILHLVLEDLYRVDEAIRIESVASRNTAIPVSYYLQHEGGRRLCPALLLLTCARSVGDRGSRMAIQLGAVVEMLRAATLVHDDIIDGDRSGTGGPSRSGQTNQMSVLTGDWLYMRAFRVAHQERVLDRVIGIAQMMAMSNLVQRDRSGDIGFTETDCLEWVDRKTACLFSVCGSLGAVVAGVETQVGGKLREFAWNLGMAFQLIDDMLDFAPRESTAGKSASRNLRKGKITLPLVYALQQASEAERNLVAGILLDRTDDAVAFANVQALVDRNGGIQRTRARAGQFTDRARQIVAEFSDSLCQRALFTLIKLIAERGS